MNVNAAPPLTGLARRLVQDGILEEQVARSAVQDARTRKLHFVAHVVESGLASSKRVARELLGAGAISLNGDDPTGPAEIESRPTAERWNKLWRNTSASILDTKAARSLLETPSARAWLDRFGTAGDFETTAAESADAEFRAPKLGSFEVMNRTIDIAQSALARHTLAAYPPDLFIEVPRNVCRSLEFHRANEVIEIGRELGAAALDTLGASES